MYNFWGQQLDNCMELCPLPTDDFPDKIVPITWRTACGGIVCQNSSYATPSGTLHPIFPLELIPR